MPFVNLPGVDLWFEDTGGSGTPVIFLHAASGTCDSWVHQLPAFTTAGYRCVTYDRRTWGRSRPTNANEQPGFVGDDLHGLVEQLGLERFHLVATAAGGITALDYALDHPERIFSLVAANTIGGVQDPEYLEVQTRLRPAEIQELPVNLRELGPSYRGTDPRRRSTMAGNRTGKPSVRDIALATGSRADHLFAAGHYEGSNADTVRGGRSALAAGADADAGGAHSHQPFCVASRCGTRGILGTTPGLEWPGAGVHRPTLVVEHL